MKTAHFLSLFGAMVLALVLVRPATASILKSAQLDMSDSRPALSSNYTFNFTHDTAATIQTVSIYFCKEPSWGVACTYPTGMGLTGIDTGDITFSVGLDTNWTLANALGNLLTINRPESGQPLLDDTIVSFTVAGITNPAVAGCNANGTNVSTGTCYAHIGTYTGTSSQTTLVDSAVVSLTVVEAVTVTARVDPTFTFVVEGVNTSTTNNGVTTSVSSTFSTLPFGNLTSGVAKYAAHKLTVTTNTQAGYTVSVQMVSQMTGVYSANNIDPFVPAAPHAAWSAPNGTTPSDNTGWIGFNTDDNDVTDWDGAGDVNQFAGVSNTEAVVMKKTTSDSGAVSNYVSYALQVNVYQPADTYTGTMIYNALPTY